MINHRLEKKIRVNDEKISKFEAEIDTLRNENKFIRSVLNGVNIVKTLYKRKN